MSLLFCLCGLRQVKSLSTHSLSGPCLLVLSIYRRGTCAVGAARGQYSCPVHRNTNVDADSSFDHLSNHWSPCRPWVRQMECHPWIQGIWTHPSPWRGSSAQPRSDTTCRLLHRNRAPFMSTSPTLAHPCLPQNCQPCCQTTHAAGSPVGLGDERDGSDTVNYQERSTALITPGRANEVPGIERCYANDGMQKARSNLGFILIKSDLLSSCFLIWTEMSPSESERQRQRKEGFPKLPKSSLEDELMNFRRRTKWRSLAEQYREALYLKKLHVTATIAASRARVSFGLILTRKNTIWPLPVTVQIYWIYTGDSVGIHGFTFYSGLPWQPSCQSSKKKKNRWGRGNSILLAVWKSSQDDFPVI